MLEEVVGMRRVTSFLFLASVFCVTFEKIHWNVAGNGLARRRPRDALPGRRSSLGTKRRACRGRRRSCSASSRRSLLVYLIGYFDLSDSDALAQWAKGLTKWAHPLRVPRGGGRVARRGAASAYYWRTLAWFCAGIVVNAAYGVLQLLDARRGGNLDATRALADHRRREPDQRLRRDQRRERLPPERDDRRPEPPRDHVDRPAARPDADLPAARARPSPARVADG